MGLPIARFGRSRPSAVLPLAEIAGSGRRESQMGALGRALAGVERLGIAVPESWVVLADVFRHTVQTSLPPGHDPASLLRTVRRSSGIERAARARERLLEVALDEAVEEEIDRAWHSLGQAAPWGVAVRASAVVSDQGVARAAGISGTEIAIFSREELGRAIRRAWATAASQGALSYLKARKIRDVAIAVLLQPVVPARASVTLVTDARRLATSRPDPDSVPYRLAIALSGLAIHGAGLVEAEVVTFDDGGTVRSARPLTQRRRRIVQGRAFAWQEVAPDEVILAGERLEELSELARRLEPLGDVVVRCVIPAEGDALVVDVLPIEHHGFPGTGTSDSLWARAAAGEAPPAPLMPLSGHLLAQPTLERVRRFVPAGVRGTRRSARLANVIAPVDGRAYVNLSPILEGRGASEAVDPITRIELAAAQWPPELWREPVARTSLARAGLRIAQIATEQRALSDDIVRFERDAEQQRRWLVEMDLAILPDDALTTTLREVSDFLSRAYELHARASGVALAGHALLASVLIAVDADRAAWLARAVASGADVVTSRPAAAFCHVAAIARLDEPARDVLVAARPRSVAALPEGPFRRALERFLHAYGDRGPYEVELGVARWGEDPSLLLDMLAVACRAEAIDPDAAFSRARSLADRQLAMIEPRLSFFETRVVRDIVSRQRELVRLRERCRARLAYGLSMMRVVALDVDRRIRRLDSNLEAGSAMMLTLDELTVALAKYRADLAPIVRARRDEHRSQCEMPSSSPVFRGVPLPTLPFPSSVLRGLGASSGTVEGRVLRLGSALEGIERFSVGSVLVVESFDTGLVPLFFHAGAVVAELGTPFSSSAVVARDCGLPAVIGIPGAWALLRDGERVRVDGDAGTVELLGP